MNYMLVWFKDLKAHACKITELPDAFNYHEEVFRPIGEYLGDVDYLRDKQNRLIGFSYTLGNSEWEEALYEFFAVQSTNVKRQEGMLMILFTSDNFDIQCVQAVGSQVYRSPNNELMLAVPDWSIGELAFKLATMETPVSTALNH